MSKQNLKTCMSCQHWLMYQEQTSGQCRRYAPRTSEWANNWFWPDTLHDDWCGEWSGNG